jgi:hypothetical protein
MAQPTAKTYHRTTVYLTDEQRQWLRRAAAKAQLEGLTVSASDVIRLASHSSRSRYRTSSSTTTWLRTFSQKPSSTQDAPSVAYRPGDRLEPSCTSQAGKESGPPWNSRRRSGSPVEAVGFAMLNGRIGASVSL